MPLLYIKRYSRALIQAHPNWLFVFGDNLARKGLGGQAKEARGEPNSVGIITKRLPHMGDDAFLADADYPRWLDAGAGDIDRLDAAHRIGQTIIWPLDGVGTGLADLKSRAPSIWDSIEALRIRLEKLP